MQFPDDAILLARGKYSTLGRERRAQLERAQKICTTLINCCSRALRDCEAKPPVNEEAVLTMGKCLENLASTRAKLIELSNEMALLKPVAWESGDE